MKTFNPDPYGADNFEIVRYNVSPEPASKLTDELVVTLTYPPIVVDHADGKVRYVRVNQESVRASDGLRVHYDFYRDGWVIEQPMDRFQKLSENHYDTITEWTEVFFAKSWALEPDGDQDEIMKAKFLAADAEWEDRNRRS